jgi:hypothetical protein
MQCPSNARGDRPPRQRRVPDRYLEIAEHRGTHSTEQTLYFDQQGLLKRHDYDVEITGGTAGAHYVSDLKEISGIVFPTKRRIFPRQPDGHSAPEPLVVSIDLDQFVLF